MAVKDTKLPQIRVTEEEKDTIYSMAKEENLNFSQFALKRMLEPVKNNSESLDCEEKLYKLIYKYEQKKRECSNAFESHQYTLKINSILDIIYDLKEIS